MLFVSVWNNVMMLNNLIRLNNDAGNVFVIAGIINVKPI